MARRKRRNAGQRGAQAEPPAVAPVVGTGLGPLLKEALSAPQDHPSPAQSPGPGRTVPPTQPAPGPEPLVPVTVPPAPKLPEPPTKTPPERNGTDTLSATELRWLNDAYAGATPLEQARRQVAPHAAPQAPHSTPGRPAPVARSGADLAAQARLSALVGEGVRFVTDQREDGWVAARRQGVGPGELRRLRGAGFRAEASLDLHGRRRDEVPAEVTRFVRTQYRRGCRYLLLVHGKGLHSEGGRGVLGDAVFDALTAGGAAPVVRALATPHEHHGGRGALAIFLG